MSPSRDVRRIGGDDVEIAFDAGEIGGGDELHASVDAVTHGVGARDRHGVTEMSVATTTDVRRVVSDGDGDAAAAGADVSDARVAGGSEATGRHAFQHFFDDHLRLGAWDQHRRCHLKIETPELPDSDDVGGRFMTRAPGDPLREPWFERRRCVAVRLVIRRA